MKFCYKKHGAKLLRPVIHIEIFHATETVRYEVFVDSGADCNIDPAEIGELLGSMSRAEGRARQDGSPIRFTDARADARGATSLPAGG